MARAARALRHRIDREWTPTVAENIEDNFEDLYRYIALPSDASRGGTGLTEYIIGDLLQADSVSTLARLAAIATGNALISGGVATASSWGKIGLATHVSGVLPVANGGTNIASYAVGDLLQADGATSLAKLAAVATGNALISGGVTTASSWGKIGLTTHVSGVLPVANGGTNISAYTLGDMIYASGTTTLSPIGIATFTQQILQKGVSSAPVWGPIIVTPALGVLLVGSSTAKYSSLAAPLAAGKLLQSKASGFLMDWTSWSFPTSATTGDVLYASATNVWSKLAAVATGKVFVSKGVTTAPAWDVVGDLPLAVISGSTFSTLQHIQNLFHSAGWLTGGAVTDGGSETIDVAAGTGMIRATDSPTAELLFFDWGAESSLAIPTDTTRFIGIEYNSGSPQVVLHTSEPAFDFNTDFILATVVNEGGVLHIQGERHAIGNHASEMVERLYQTLPFARDNRTGGLIIGESGTLNITMSAGNLWERLERFDLSAIDTNVSGDFETYHRDGSGGWTLTTGVTQWPNETYDDDSGSPTAMTNNRWSSRWWYIELDGILVMVYGQSQFVSEGQAEADTPPASLPDRITQHGKLIAHMIFQKSASTAERIESVFDTTFAAAVVTDHGNLGGLSDDDHTQYALVTGTRAFSGAITVPNSGIHILDTGGDHDLILAVGEDVSADRTLTLTLGNADRTLTLSGNPTLADWFDQAVKVASSPAFAGVTLGNTGLHLLDTGGDHDLIIKLNEDVAADRTLSILMADADRTLSVEVIQPAEVTFTTTGNIDDLDFNNAHLIRMNNASLATIRGLAAGLDGQRVVIKAVGAGVVELAHLNAGSVSANRFINMASSANSSLKGEDGYAEYIYDGTTNMWRMVNHQQGAVLSWAFDAAHYTGSASMTWTLTAGDVVIENYNMSGNLYIVNVLYNLTTVGGTLSTLLRATLPGGFSIAADGRLPYQWIQVATPGVAIGTVSGSQFHFQVDSIPSNWSAATNSTVITATGLGIVN